MGARKALRALESWGGRVPPTSLCVLVYMALRSPDPDPQTLYWAGVDAIVTAVLGREPSTTTRRAVRRSMAELFEAGAVKLDKASAPGRHARYALNLDAYRGEKVAPVQGRESDPCDGGEKVAPVAANRGEKVVITGAKKSPPEEEEEELKAGMRETHNTHKAPATRPRTGPSSEPIAAQPVTKSKRFNADSRVRSTTKRLAEREWEIQEEEGQELEREHLVVAFNARLTELGYLDPETGARVSKAGQPVKFEVRDLCEEVDAWLDRGGDEYDDDVPEIVEQAQRTRDRAIKSAARDRENEAKRAAGYTMTASGWVKPEPKPEPKHNPALTYCPTCDRHVTACAHTGQPEMSPSGNGHRLESLADVVARKGIHA